MFRRLCATLAVAALSVLALSVTASPAYAGSAHFVGAVSISRTADSLTASGKIAGLGNEPQVHVVLSASAACVNPGGNGPQAANKMTVTAEGDFPVQNGQALFSLTVTAAFQPSCSPPMSVVFSDVTVTDTTSGISVAVPGIF